jgi:DNA helicase-2/ATP-dependent DNA helicase PcrA
MTQSFEERYIKARRAVIAADFSGLNEMQREAVLTTEGPLLLLAGAGSGKTTVLINRVANLLRYGRGSDSAYVPPEATEADLAVLEAGPSEAARALAALEPCEPWRILAITFTNKAAGELKSRLEAQLGPAANDIWAQTFHSACVRILRRDAERLGYPSSFTIYDTSDSQSVMKHILKEMDVDEKMLPHRAVLGQISKAKDDMITAEQFLEQANASGDLRRKKMGEAYVRYEKRLFEAGAMDFDDLIYNTVLLLREHEDVRDYYQRKFRYILIDEYQDTNNLQYQLAALLAGGRENICVVGDDDQSIYKFRGATIENILNFEHQYEGARTIRLEQNYRSTSHILNAANAVIRNNQGRKGKELWTEKPEGEKLTLYVAHNEHEEAQYIASSILASFSAGAHWKDHAVLYRMNAQSNQIERAFKRNGVPYRIIGGTRFFDRAEIKDILAYLTVILTPSDDLRLARIINVPARGIGPTTVERAGAIAAEEGRGLFAVLRDADHYPDLQRAAVKLRLFVNLIEDFRGAAETLPLDQLYDLVIERTGYLKALQEKNLDENLARIENVKELKSNILSYMENTGDHSLSGFLDEVSLYTDLDNYDQTADSVVMMTMHAAKGLEFPTVFIAGAEEGIFPGIRAIGEVDEMEEERRLCYVAITRAMKKLHICCAQQRMIFGHTTSNKISRFVGEIPSQYIEQKSASTGQQHGEQHRVTSGGKRVSTPAKPAFRFTPPGASPSGSSGSTMPAFKTGDSVQHKAFGEGVIVKMTPVGGDALVEIEFQGIGLKRLMLRAAAQHMERLG